ncbi:MAG: PilZ domain-containing protein [Magnetovibrio sp.]|nr:PilZ domain-containing protein [Magnetovibrio sp.]
MSQTQRDTRSDAALEGAVTIDGVTHRCRVKNISFKGAQLSTDALIEKDAKVSLTIEPFGSVLGLVKWNAKNKSGIEFKDRPQVIEDMIMGLASYSML